MSHFPTTNPQLLASLVDNPCAAKEWDAFVKLYEPAMHEWFRRKGLNPTDAQDCSQRVMLRLIQSLSTYAASSETGSFRRWLYRVAINESISFVRTESKHRSPIQRSELLADIAAKSDEHLSQELSLEVRRRVFREAARVVEQLVAPHQWQAFWRTYVLRESVSSVATDLNLNIGTIYVAKGRILKLLQQHVAKIQGEDV